MTIPQNRKLAGGTQLREITVVDVVTNARKAKVRLISKGVCQAQQ
jgi:hypothetical protein